MENKKTAEYDFETWAELARSNPGRFEAMRLAAIAEFIDSAPPAQRERLVRLQWRIDQERRLARNPLSACVRISRMMWRQVVGPNGLQQRLGELGGLLENPRSSAADGATPESARVLAFASARD